MSTDHPIEFRLSENPWAPTAVVEEINLRTASGLVLTGLADQVGGVSSAAFVAWPDGRQSALTRPRASLSSVELTATVLNEVRKQGLPVPAYQLVLDLHDGYVAVVQERLPGRHVEHLDQTTVAAFVAANDRFAGLLRRHPEVPPPPDFPTHGPGYGVFEDTIGGYGTRGRRLLARLLEVDSGRPLRMHGDDLVHTDYSPGNVLFDDSGQVSGIVDWNFGVARGDRHYALVGLPWGSIGRSTIKPAEQRAIDAVLGRLESVTLRSYQAHHAVHRVHRSITEGFARQRIEADLGFAEEIMS
ncbi:phosphotransferase [Microlunatus parietis]|uniref:Aminoglycoside phosphotransferase (APT) family kinase protein n=1 Tax=Microlunatus parietis TaxID=682979 RepID=A0A7Y9LBJ3_9ACTN|nr:phosphotransferase [Microlunatus parietis]NYE70710.1 aminoglycoside phosphotransferase (APT) family kinase protein [Microlunatus parietis]